MSEMRRLYVCTLCSTAHCHPRIYCMECPGRLEPRDLPNPPHVYSDADFPKWDAWLASHGLRDGRC